MCRCPVLKADVLRRGAVVETAVGPIGAGGPWGPLMWLGSKQIMEMLFDDKTQAVPMRFLFLCNSNLHFAMEALHGHAVVYVKW